MGIIVSIPFDSAPGALTTPDYGPGQTPATVHNGATFAPGKKGYAGHFEGTGYIRPKNPPIDLTGPFTVMFWHKAQQFDPYSTPLTLGFQFAFADSSIKQFAQPVTLNKWEHWAFVRNGYHVTVYKNFLQVSLMYLKNASFVDSHPTEWAIKQVIGTPATLTAILPMTFGGNDSPYAQGEIDQLLIYNEALTITQITGTANPENGVLYWIDGVPFLDHGVYVSASKGVVDGLKLKESVKVDWNNEHGTIVDLVRPRHQNREIELDCFMKADSNIEFAMKVDAFIQQFVTAGLHRLKIEIDSYKPLVYEVYCPDGTVVKKQWRPEALVGTFTLKLVDPQPVKRVLRYTQPVTAPTQGILSPFPAGFKGVYINIQCQSPLNIFWGDGTSTLDVLAESPTLLSHSFPIDDKPYEIMICGEPNDIESFITNAIVIWNRL